MVKIQPIIPIKVSEDILNLIMDHCPISQIEDDDEHVVYKYVGLIGQAELHYNIPAGFKPVCCKRHMCSLYENKDECVAVFWIDHVLIVMLSNTDEQHEAVMLHYEDMIKGIPAKCGMGYKA